MKKKIDQIKVLSFPNAFTWEKKEKVFEGKTRLSEIMAKALVRPDMIDRANVWIYDKELKYPPIHVKPTDYDSIIVKPNTMVTLRVCPTGGGEGGSKNIIRIVATIALIVITAGYALPFATAIGVSEAVGAAIMMTVGTFAINALIPPPQMNFDRGGGAAKESPTLSITGSGNRMNNYGVVPRVFGLHKVFPTMAAYPYTEIFENQQYLRLLFDFGYGELELSQLKIGNTLLTEFEDVETEIQYGTGAEADFKLYSTQINEVAQSLIITQAGGAQVLTTSTDSNEAIIDGYFAGLVSISDDSTNQDLDVVVTYEYSLTGVGSYTLHSTTTYTNNTRQTYYVSERIPLPTADQYDIRITRITADTASDLILDTFTVSNIKSVTASPPINVTGRCMVAMRIRASEQLNGMIDSFNALAQAKLPTWNGSAWTAAVATRNPAWAYAEVLRGAANNNPIDDSMIDGDGLKTWADACDAIAQDGNPKWQFDGVIDFQSTVFEALRDISAAGRASFAMADGKYSVIQDLEQSTPVQHFSPRNSWSFEATKVFSDTIHGIKCRFINPDRDYQSDEVIAYDDGYTSANATKFVTMQFWGCTNKSQAWREGRYALAVSRLRPEIYTLNVDVENIICTRGDLVRVTHDVTGWGQKGARIKTVTLNGSSECTSITIDEEVTMVSGTSYNLRLRADDGDSSLEPVDTDVGTVTSLTFTTAIAAASVPKVGDLVMFGEASLESVELIVKSIEPSNDLTAKLTLLDAAPLVHSSDTGIIPAFDPYITNTPPRLTDLPDKPLILQIYSDENAVIYHQDGSTTPQIIIDIAPPNAGTSLPRVSLEVRYKESASAKYSYLQKYDGMTTRISLDFVVTGRKYDLGIRATSFYGRTSEWVTYLGYQVIGRTTAPATPANFTINVVDTVSHLFWTKNTEPDLSHYIIRFSSKTTGALYENAIDILPAIPKEINSAIAPSRTGTYFIKAFDTLDISSEVAAEVTTLFDSIKNLNVIETQTESPTFSGAKSNCLVNSEGYLVLDNTVLWDAITGNMDDWVGLIDAGGGSTGSIATEGTYDFNTYIDLGSKYTSRATSTIDQTAIDYSNSFDALLGWLDELQGAWDDLNGDTAPDTSVKVQVAVTDDDPSGTPTWSDFIDVFVGDFAARALKFRCVLTSSNVYQTPRVETLSVEVDMPDRIDAAEDISSGAGTKSITFSPAFKALKGIGITAQDMAQGDYYEITNKATTGFDITFKDSGESAVDRTFDWSAKGYGHLVT